MIREQFQMSLMLESRTSAAGAELSPVMNEDKMESPLNHGAENGPTFSTVEAALAAGSCKGLYLRIRLKGEHLAIRDWEMEFASRETFVRFRRLERGLRPPGYQLTLADKDLDEGQYWSEPLYKESKAARWEDNVHGPEPAEEAETPEQRALLLSPQWRTILLKLDRLACNAQTDDIFLIECCHKPHAPIKEDTELQIGFAICSVRSLLVSKAIQLLDYKERSAPELAKMMHLLLHSSHYKHQTSDTLTQAQVNWPGVIRVQEVQVVDSRHLFFETENRARKRGEKNRAGEPISDAQRLQEIADTEEREVVRLQRELHAAEAQVANNLVQFT